MAKPKTQIMYIERKEESLDGPARIGRVKWSKSGRSLEYAGRRFHRTTRGHKYNYFDEETGDAYWISGPRRDGRDRLYPNTVRPVVIDDDAREEYWTEIRKLPQNVSSNRAN